MAAQATSRPSRPDRNQLRPKPTNPRQAKRSHQVRDVQQLQEAVDAFDEQSTEIKTFSHLPLSEPTAEGLQASHFQSLTDIQARAIPLALKGRDLLGAAKTGSGKTLAFLVPVLEKLHRARWTELDGLGALILSPTRELAVQTFEVLRKVGRRHPFSAGLVIGGKSLREEADRLGRMNILVCTPGRMLQHLDQTVGLDVDSLQVLVLDEADRIMDLGFQRDVDALLEHLPPGRQTLMFSATQSRKVSDLARLSLRDPEYVSVHEAAAAATPAGLQQHYIVVPLPDKIDTLWGFVKANLKSKMIVFLSSGKQVRFAYEAFRQLRPAISLLHLHGRQRQLARLAVTEKFTAAQSACLFATDVVARGIDFPAVDWVIQVDCPESADTYIHRVGRTARYQSSGRAVLFLDPSEEAGMLRRLEQKKVPIQKLNVRERKKKSIRSELQSMCFKSTDMKYLGQKAFISYAKSIHRHADKEIFNLDSLDCGAFAASLGLPGAPQIRLQKGDGLPRRGNVPYALLESSSEDSESGGDDGGKKAKPKPKATTVRTKYDRMVERVNQDVLSGHYTKIVDDEDGGVGTDREADEQEEFLSVKRRIPNDDDPAEEEAGGGGQDAYALAAKTVAVFGSQPFVVDSKRREKILKSKKKMLKYMPRPEKIVFDEEGNPGSAYGMKTEEDFRRAGAPEEQRQHFLDTEATRVQEDDIDDKALAKQKRREKKLKRKAREGPLERVDEPAGSGAGLGLMDQDGADADPLALLRSLPIAGARLSADEQTDSELGGVQEERPRKKARVSDSDESGGGGGAAGPRPKDGAGAKKARKRKDGRRHGEREDYGYGPSNLEDLEALAIGLLDA